MMPSMILANARCVRLSLINSSYAARYPFWRSLALSFSSIAFYPFRFYKFYHLPVMSGSQSEHINHIAGMGHDFRQPPPRAAVEQCAACLGRMTASATYFTPTRFQAKQSHQNSGGHLPEFRWLLDQLIYHPQVGYFLPYPVYLTGIFSSISPLYCSASRPRSPVRMRITSSTG